MGIQPRDTLLDIGAGDGAINAMYSIAVPDFHQVLVDIDAKKLVAKRVEAHFQKLQQLYRANNNFSYQLVVNEANSLPLPSASFKKILCRRSFHEFSEPERMIGEIRRVLQDSGEVVIIEGVPTHQLQQDPGCHKPYVTASHIINFIETQGFVLHKQDEEMMWFDNNRQLVLLTFKKKPVAAETNIVHVSQ